MGAGPAGLVAANQPNLKGYTVTVFEKNEAPGGLLRYGIPNFKLNKAIIDRRIEVLEKEGIVFCYNQEIDVDNLAKEVNLSVSSFYRLFKDVTSDTPVQYLKKIRLNKAKEMIITQNAKAYVAALEVGYQSVSQFSREFKRYFGVTPAALKVT